MIHIVLIVIFHRVDIFEVAKLLNVYSKIKYKFGDNNYGYFKTVIKI